VSQIDGITSHLEARSVFGVSRTSRKQKNNRQLNKVMGILIPLVTDVTKEARPERYGIKT